MLEWDKQALFWINSHHHPVLDVILFPITEAGEMGVIWIVVILGMLVFGKPEHKKMALLFAVTLLIVDRVFSVQLGHLFPRTRPYLALEGVRQMGIQWKFTSFPSGHAHSCWLAAVILGSRYRKLLAPLIVFAILTCYSRPYFGMHYPLDVIGGALLGVVSGGLVVTARARAVTEMRRRSTAAPRPPTQSPADAPPDRL